jgi:hypothetical protein
MAWGNKNKGKGKSYGSAHQSAGRHTGKKAMKRLELLAWAAVLATLLATYTVLALTV